MDDMKELARLVSGLKEHIDACTRCGMCLSVCPVFTETGREPDVARGKLAVLDGLIQKLFKNPKGVSDRLSRCVLCGTCAFNCPGNVNILEIFIKVRVIISGFIRLPWYKKVIFRWLLASPGIFNFLVKRLRPIQKIFIKPASHYIGTSCARFFSPILKQRHFIPLAPTSFHELTPSIDTQPGTSGIKVAFFPGCIVDNFFPHVAKSALSVFKHHQVGVFLPEGLGCCGIPALTEGDRITFKRLMHVNLEKLDASEFDILITPCATCTYTIKKLWPLFITDEMEKIKHRVNKLSSITMDINEFLVKHIGFQSNKSSSHTSNIISYHDPCHLKKSLNVSLEPRIVLQANPKYTFKEMKDADLCCGMGGSFNLTNYEISACIGERKRMNILHSGCDVLATGCPACMIHISDTLSKAGDKIKVKHTIEIYSESLK